MPDARILPTTQRIRIPPGAKAATIVMGHPVYQIGGRFWTADGYPYRPGMFITPRSSMDQAPVVQSPPSLLFDNPSGSRPDQTGAVPDIPSPGWEPDLLMPPMPPAASWSPDAATPGGPLPSPSPRISGPPPMTSPPAPDQVDLADLVQRVKMAESGGRGGARSPAGAFGLMQLMPATGAELARQIGEEYNPTDTPEGRAQNMRLGKRYLAQQLAAFNNNPVYALAAYNWGPGNVRKWISAGADPSRLPAETQAYIKRILGTGASPGANPPPSPTQVQVQRNALPADVDYQAVLRTMTTAPQVRQPTADELNAAEAQRLRNRPGA